MNQPEHEASLSRTLTKWVVDEPLPPGFREQVWKRIADAEAPRNAPVLGIFVRLLEVVVPRPKFAFSYAVALMLVGVAAGALAAQAKVNHLDAALGAHYLQSINPYQSTTSLP